MSVGDIKCDNGVKILLPDGKKLKWISFFDKSVAESQIKNVIKQFDTQFNGGKTYRVIYSKSRFAIFALDYDHKTRKYTRGKFIMQDAYENMFIGDDKKTKGGFGNTVLIKLTKKSYLSIVDFSIKSFESPEEILSYHSPIGNSSVAYPYAYSKNNVYLMLEDVYLANWQDPYAAFYKFYKPLNIKKIHST